ncbi:DUF362 domain-containing protein [Desulfofustis limnaeus]|jgi:ferredoxin|nr:4Fe-4S dicluster domain-containing protein [Desulfofustis limnaeus]MDX9894426.1 4Fe-4S dicluster domain-containing protein [Desulfofustis sp.]
MNLFSFFTPERDLAPVQIIVDRCLRKRLAASDCRKCTEVCASGALRLDRREIRFEPDHCSSCMRCVAVCPNEALVSRIGMEQIVASLAGRDSVVITCERQHPPATEKLVVPCLGLFSPLSLLAVAASGCPNIRFEDRGCDTCRNRTAAEQFREALSRSADAAARLCGTTLARGSNQDHQETHQGQRRSYLFHLGQTIRLSSSSRSETWSSEQRSDSASRRRLPLSARLIAGSMQQVDPATHRLWRDLCGPRLTITGSCSPCPRCTGICPTGALKRDGRGSAKRLLFNWMRCTSCGLCVSFCKASAINLQPPPLLDPSQPLPPLA